MSSRMNSAIETLVDEYLKSKFNISLKDIANINVKQETKKVIIEEEDNEVPEEKVEVTKDTKKEVKSVNDVLKPKKVKTEKAKCVFLMSKGKNQGQPCGSGVCEESKSGQYCKKHLSQENEVKKEAKEEKKPKAKKEEPILSKKELQEKIEKRTSEIEVKRNKFGNFEHQGSGIVLDRNTHKAYGKQNDDGTVSELTEEDIEFCKSIGFKYILPSNIKSKDDEKEENDEEEEEDDDLDVSDEDIDDDE